MTYWVIVMCILKRVHDSKFNAVSKYAACRNRKLEGSTGVLQSTTFITPSSNSSCSYAPGNSNLSRKLNACMYPNRCRKMHIRRIRKIYFKAEKEAVSALAFPHFFTSSLEALFVIINVTCMLIAGVIALCVIRSKGFDFLKANKCKGNLGYFNNDIATLHCPNFCILLHMIYLTRSSALACESVF